MGHHGCRSLAAEARPEAAFRENMVDDTVLPRLTPEDLKEIGVPIRQTESLISLRRNCRRFQ
jgi:hypothetical protein